MWLVGAFTEALQGVYKNVGGGCELDEVWSWVEGGTSEIWVQ